MSLGIIVLVLGVSTAASWLWPRVPDRKAEGDSPAAEIRQRESVSNQ